MAPPTAQMAAVSPKDPVVGAPDPPPAPASELPAPGDLARWPGERLEAALVGAAALEAAAKARFLVLLGEFVARRGWESWGCLGPVQWLSWQCGLGAVAASEHVRVAGALRELPAITAALASGAVSWSKVRAVTRVASPASEADWLNAARSAPAAQLESIVRAHRRVTAGDVDREVAARSLSWRQEPDGAVVFQLRLPPAPGAAVVAAVEEATTPEAGVPIAARRGDALVELLLGPEPAHPTVLILTTAEALAGGPGPCLTDHGIAVDTETAAVAACDGAPLIVPETADATDDDHSGLDQPDFPRETGSLPAERGQPDLPRETGSLPAERGQPDLPRGTGSLPAERGQPDLPRETGAEPGRRRQRRYPTRATRRALLARDRACRFPGCHHAGRLDAHHLVHWVHGGPRHLANLVLLCPGHHRLVHRQRLALRLDGAGELIVERADGSPLHPPPPGEPPPAGPATVLSPPEVPTADWDGKPIDFAFVVACLATAG